MTTKPPKPHGKKKKEKKRTLRDLTRIVARGPEWAEAWREIRQGAPRGAVLIATATVQNCLIRALQQRFLMKPPFKLERLLDAPGPLHTFNGSIEMGLALGLYGPIIYQDLQTIRRIRNGFAHSEITLNFDTPEVAAEIDQLRFLRSIKQNPPTVITVTRHGRVGELGSFIDRGTVPTAFRDKFVLTCEFIARALATYSGDDTTRPKEPRLP